ncbi:MAG: hypothetical protein RLZ10_1991, partial [Bacteroidota bacterium]
MRNITTLSFFVFISFYTISQYNDNRVGTTEKFE